MSSPDPRLLQHQAEALRSELAALHDLLDGALDALVRTTPDGMIAFASARIFDLVGWRPSELLGRAGIDFIDPDDHERLRAHLQRVRATGASELPLDLRLKHRDGQRRWAQVVYRAQRGVDGRLRGFVANWREMSAQSATELALRRSPEWHLLVNELGRCEYVVWCADGGLTSTSPGYAKLLGFAPGEQPGPSLADWMRYILPDDRVQLEQRIAAANHEPRPPAVRFRVQGYDERVRTLESKAQYIFDEHGALCRVTAVLRDLTESVMVEQALRERTRLLQGLLDDLPDGVLQLDRELKVTYASPQCGPVLGVRPEQLLGRRLGSAWPQADVAARTEAALGQALADGSGGELELVLQADGQRRDVQVRYTVERGATPERDSVLALARDVSSLKQAELKARSAVDRLQRMLDSTDFGVLTCAADERIGFANRRLEQLFGYDPGELLGLPFAILLGPEAQRSQVERMAERRAGISAVYEQSFRRRDGSPVRCRVNAIPLFDEHGEFEGSIGLWTDLSEREQAQNRARRLADRLTYLLETVGEGIAFLDPQGRVMFANARLEKMLGSPVGALIGRPGPVRLPQIAELAALKQRTDEFQAEVECADGTRLACSVRLRVAFDEAGGIEGVIATLIDSSDARRGRDAIKRLSRLLDTAGEGICFTNAYDHIQFANRKLEQLLGYEPGGMVGLRDTALLPPGEHSENLRRGTERRAGAGESYEAQLRRRDGALVPCDVNVTPLFDEAGRFEGNLATIVDLSQREQLRQEARSTTEWLEATLSSAGIGSFDVDLASGVVRTAGLVRELYGEPFSFDRWLNAIHEADRPAVSAALNSVQQGQTARVEFRQAGSTPERWFYGVLNVVTAAGMPVPVPVPAAGGAPVAVQRVIGTLIDVSVPKQLERERADLHSQISQTQRQESLGLLAGGVAHDFNNLLTSAVGHLELVKLGAAQHPELVEGLELVDQAHAQMGALARQLQLYSGKGQVSFRRCDLNAAVQAILAILRVSAGKHAELKLELCSEPLPLLGDATQLQQIVMNLTINAAEAIGATGGSITVRTEQQALEQIPKGLRGGLAGSRFAFLGVADSGAGMPPEVRARIFEPFFSSKSNGRGLGLAVVVGAVKAHRGVIDVQSRPGHGTSFSIWLPLTDEAAGAAVATATPARAVSRTLKGTIALIDDEEPVRSMVRRALLLRGLKVLEAADGEQAIALVEQHPEIDAVVMDIIMPKLSGVDAYLRLRAAGHQLPVVLMSGFAERSVLDKLDADPPQALLRKPFKPAELYEQLEKLLKGGA